MDNQNDNDKNKKGIGKQLLSALGFVLIVGVVLLVFFFMAISE